MFEPRQSVRVVDPKVSKLHLFARVGAVYQVNTVSRIDAESDRQVTDVAVFVEFHEERGGATRAVFQPYELEGA